MNVIQTGDVKTIVTMEDGNLITGTVQDCTPILEDAKARNREGLHGTSEMRHAARFPAVIVETYLNEHGITLDQFLKERVHVRRMLSDPALSGFRIWEGRV